MRSKLKKLILESIEPELQVMINSKDIDVVRQAMALLSGTVEYAYNSGNRQYVQEAVLPILRKYKSLKSRFEKNKNSWHGYFPNSIEEWDRAQREFDLNSRHNYQPQGLHEPAPHLPPRHYLEDRDLLGIYQEFLYDTLKFLK